MSLIVNSDRHSVAVIGTGRMGSAMARVLVRAGLELTLWNRTAGKADDLAAELGAEVAPSPSEAAEGASFILSSLADDAALREAYLGPDGVINGLQPGSLVIETSTVDPDTTRRVGMAVDETGSGYIDAPVSGSVSTVAHGALTIMVGGDPGLMELARPVLGPLSSRVIHVGDRGAGAACKLAVNGLVHGLNVALAEALVLAERAGIDRTTAYEVFASGAGGAPFVQYKRQAYEHPETAPVAFSLDLVAKDLELITGLGSRLGVPMEQAGTGLGIVEKAIKAGMGDRDLSAVAVYLRGEGA